MWTVSNSLIAISAVFTVLGYVTNINSVFWINDSFYNAWMYLYWFLQMFTSQFLHGDFMHLVMNAFFVLYFWNALESIIWKSKMLIFFILNSIFLWMCLTFLTNVTTVWISGFALAILTYYTLILWSKWSPEYTWWITAIVINIAIGLAPWISFLWHFWWMLFWAIFWFLSEKKK